METEEQNMHPIKTNSEIIIWNFNHPTHRCLDASIKKKSTINNSQCNRHHWVLVELEAIKETQPGNSRNEKCKILSRNYKCKLHKQNIREGKMNLDIGNTIQEVGTSNKENVITKNVPVTKHPIYLGHCEKINTKNKRSR